MTIVWEKMDHDQSGYLYRAKVHGGWLVKEVNDVLHTIESANMMLVDGHEFRSSLCFIPDVDHSWGG